jgi:cell division transport system ATP-binding protein
LRELGLKERYDAKPLTLSGGEQQRVAIARALVNEPTLLLADEPTGNIDKETAGEIMGLLVKVRDRGATILIATHDHQIIRSYGTRLILLDHGVLVDDLAQASGR